MRAACLGRRRRMVVASTSQRKGGDPPLDEFLSVEKKRRKRRGPRPRDILPSHCRPAFFICIQCRRRHPRGFEPFPALSTRRIIRMSFNMAAHSKLPNERANRANTLVFSNSFSPLPPVSRPREKLEEIGTREILGRGEKAD